MAGAFDKIHDIVLEIMKIPDEINSVGATAEIIRIARKPHRVMWPTKRR